MTTKLLFKMVKLNKTKPEEIKKIFDSDPSLDINVKNVWAICRMKL